MAVLLILFLAPLVAFAIARRGRVGLGLIMAVGQGQWLAGSYSVADGFGRLFAVCAVGAVFLLAGYLSGGRKNRTRTASNAIDGRDGLRRALKPLALITIALTVVHFSRAGIPLFSSNVETGRFDVSSSGLLGVPSRAYLYGLPFIVLSYSSLRRTSRSERRLLVLSVMALVVSRIFGGLKSGLTEVLFISVIALVVRTRGTASIAARATLRRVVLGIVALIFAGLVSTQYATVRSSSGSATVAYLARRITAGSVSAGEYALAHLSTLTGGPYLLGDGLYYINRYTGGLLKAIGLGVPDYSFGWTVSAGMQHLPVSTDLYVTPVAAGMGPSLFLDGGWALVVLGMFAAGYAVRRAEIRAFMTEGIRSGAWATAGLVGCYIVVNGGPGYYLVNVLVVLAVYLVAARSMVGIATGLEGVGNRVPGERWEAERESERAT